MAYQPVDVIEVSAWGRVVGAVAPADTSRTYAFEYTPEWIAGGVELAPLHLRNQPGVFTFPELSPDTFYGLPAMLADVLPDRFGNALVNAWMVDHGVAPAEITPLDRLAYAADRAMGALTFAPPVDHPADDATAVHLADLVVAARAQVSGSFTAPEAADALHQLITVGTSAGGARAKAVIAYHPDTGQVRSGQLDAPDGFEHWLVKLDGVGDPDVPGVELGETQPYTRVEYAYHLMATAAGIDMEPCRLLPEGPRTHFLTRRFDRGPAGERIHLQSLCAMAHLDFNQARAHSYASYLATVDRLGMGPADLEQAFRRIAFNVAAFNCDDHTKNLAFVLADGDRWRLSPAYDVTFAYNPDGRWTSMHQMAVGGKFEGIDADDLFELGDRYGVPAIRSVFDDVRRAVAAWPDFATEAGVPASTIARIQEVLDARPLG